MDLSLQKEQFCRAFVHALASAAGITIQTYAVDEDSVDIGFATPGKNGTVRAPRLEAQLKCSSQELLADDGIHFPLKVKNYEELRPTNLVVPRILVVTLVPDDCSLWADLDENRLLLRHCCWWVSLRGRPQTSNTGTVTVILPRANLFTPEALTALMARISGGGAP